MRITLTAGSLTEDVEAVTLADGRHAVPASPALLRRLDAGDPVRHDGEETACLLVRSGRAHAEAVHLMRSGVGPLARRRFRPPETVALLGQPNSA